MKEWGGVHYEGVGWGVCHGGRVCHGGVGSGVGCDMKGWGG